MGDPINLVDPEGLFTTFGGFGGSGVAGVGGEASQGFYYDWSGGDFGSFVSAGLGLGANLSADLFGGVILDDISGVTRNYNVVIGLVSITVLTDPETNRIVGGTVGVGPVVPIAGVPVGGSVTQAATFKFSITDILRSWFSKRWPSAPIKAPVLDYCR